MTLEEMKIDCIRKICDSKVQIKMKLIGIKKVVETEDKAIIDRVVANIPILEEKAAKKLLEAIFES